LTVLAQKLARAVYDMLTRDVGFARDSFLQSYGWGVGEHAASRGASLATVLCHDAPLASTNAHEHRSSVPRPWAFDWTPALAPIQKANVTDGYCGLPLTRT
jgi:hypothetical protein